LIAPIRLDEKRDGHAADRRSHAGELIRVLAEVKQKPLIQGLEVNGGVTAESANSSTKRRASGAE
jgi:hypothetical protein